MDTTTSARPSRLRAGLVAAGAAMGLTLAGLGVSAAQTDDAPTPTDPPASAPAAPEGAPEEMRPPGGPGPGGRGGGGGRQGVGRGALHGEFVTNAPDGGYQTVATQKGEVTSVNAASITVESEDGFSRTYSVNDDTLVNAGNDGIADVQVGDDVGVKAIVTGGNAAAVDVRDGTQIKALREKWSPRPGAPAASSSTTNA
ncbi:MAG TPA: hypothetical protein VF230_02480 [Acidimicrobiales bacterium]